MKSKLLALLIAVVGAVAVGADFWRPGFVKPPVDVPNGISNTVPNVKAASIPLVPQKGDERIDSEIRKLQEEARSKQQPPEVMKRLGWAFVRKARLSYDPGYYKLAEQCALAVEFLHADDPDALLLRGHILQSLHRFKEAEPIARKLTKARHDSADEGLLGDVLMEQGRLSEAIGAYQEMVNLRPDLQSYTRVAHLRWLKGDLEGAIALSQAIVDDQFETGEMIYRGPAVTVLVESLLQRGAAGDVQTAQEVIDRLAAVPTDPGFVLHEIPLLRLRALLARQAGDQTGYHDWVDRYRATATACGFQGHMAMAEAMRYP